MVIDMLSRRGVLQGIGAAALMASLARPARAVAQPALRYVGARMASAQSWFATGFASDGTVICDLPLPARGHGFARHPRSGAIVAFGRRPGRFAMVFDPASGERPKTIPAAEDRRFCGHGLFARGGAMLIATELEYSTGEGILGLYDSGEGYRRIGEYRSGGLDPHEILLLPDGITLAVANGGILTDPDAPGIKLNRDSMESSLVYIDARDGALLARFRLPDEYAQLSLRHMAMAQDGSVAIGMQYEGPSGDRVPLVATHRHGDQALALLEAPESGLSRLRNYCGSVAVDGASRILAVTSPVGGVTGFWDLPGRRFVGVADMRDVCGLAATRRDGEFVITSGLGGAATVNVAERAAQPLADAALAAAQWDNHLLPIGV